MRVVIAAYACLLVVNRPDVPRSHFYDELYSMLVYPTPFIVAETHHHEDGVVSEDRRVLSGQAWDSRRIILSWQDIEESLAAGHNVVLHEFAHYLDMEDEMMDGAPGLGSGRAYQQWSEVFWDEYDRMCADVRRVCRRFSIPMRPRSRPNSLQSSPRRSFSNRANSKRSTPGSTNSCVATIVSIRRAGDVTSGAQRRRARGSRAVTGRALPGAARGSRT